MAAVVVPRPLEVVLRLVETSKTLAAILMTESLSALINSNQDSKEKLKIVLLTQMITLCHLLRDKHPLKRNSSSRKDRKYAGLG